MSLSSETPFAKSDFCWVAGLPAGRNQFVSFERRFVRSDDGPIVIHLFADTRFRLFVNEQFVAYGPGRFVTQHPEYDTYALGPFLNPGENRVRVEVNYYGCSSYQTMPDGQPGFIAAGGNDTIDFSTPSGWLATIHEAWDADAPYFSFAQNPSEICDTAKLESELAKSAVLPIVTLTSDRTPWAKPTPRTAPYPDYALTLPAWIMAAGPAVDRLRWGMQLRHSMGAQRKEYVSIVTWIHSPKEQTVSLDIFWTEGNLNGEPISIAYPGRLGNHGESSVNLREGWNFLGVNYEILLNQWSFMLGLPFGCGATLHGRPDLGCTEAFAVSEPLSERVTPTCPASPDSYVLPAGWKLIESDLLALTPARLTAWETPKVEEVVRDKPFKLLHGVSTRLADTAIWSFDFQDEYYGQPVIEVEAPAGSILDVAYDDWSRADGCVNLYNSNPFTEAVDRFILKGGRQRIVVLNPRGGIYLELVLRAPEGSKPVLLTVHDVAIRRRTVFNSVEGAFTCGDPVLDWSWRTGVRTLQASSDEAYSDCPWRERGSYIADCLVNLHLNRLLTADLSVAKRTFLNFGLAQFPEGLLSGCAPAWLRGASEDFTLFWVLGVHDIWAHTGDVEFAARQWPVLQRVFASTSWKVGSDGLWDAAGLFMDWGMTEADRVGKGNAALNVLRVGALRDAAELAGVLGHHSDQDRFASEAGQVAAALNRHLWNEEEGRFNASIGSTTSAVHANVLAARFGIGQTERILAYLEPLLLENFKAGISGAGNRSYCELFFFFFVLPALAENDRAELAEKLIQEHYGFIRNLGHPTLPETFNHADHGSGSCCHSWSGAPALYATEYVLGLRLLAPGNPDAFRLSPVHAGRDHAEGTLPHRLGSIHVKWERRGDRIVAMAIAPEGVTLIPGPGVDIHRS